MAPVFYTKKGLPLCKILYVWDIDIQRVTGKLWKTLKSTKKITGWPFSGILHRSLKLFEKLPMIEWMPTTEWLTVNYHSKLTTACHSHYKIRFCFVKFARGYAINYRPKSGSLANTDSPGLSWKRIVPSTLNYWHFKETPGYKLLSWHYLENFQAISVGWVWIYRNLFSPEADNFVKAEY